MSHSWSGTNRATGFLSRERSGVRDNWEVVGWRMFLSGEGTRFVMVANGRLTNKCQILSEKMERNVFSKKKGFCQFYIVRKIHTNCVR